MKKIVFVSLDADIIEELDFISIMSCDIDYELHCIKSLENVEASVISLNPDLVVLSYEAMTGKETWNFNKIPVAFLARTKKELNDGARYGYPTVGIANNPLKIAEILGKKTYTVSPEETSKKDVPKEEIPIQETVTEKKTESNHIHNTEKSNNLPVMELEELQTEDDLNPVAEVSHDKESLMDVLEELPESHSDESENIDNSFREKPTSVTKPEPAVNPKNKSENINKKSIVREEFERDAGKTAKKTKVITVYSAKGGVGKTTIAAELATYLSLVDVGRRRLKVCIVDYNIDFGDVRSTVHMDSDKLNLTHWAAEVQELLERGKRPSEIRYSKEEIEDWLSVEKRSGLYVLPAPLTNEDSMGIESDALSIILDNIVEYGGFDYVICDTGNNTRDSTMIALEHADMILLIMTQNVNTANCDKAFIDTMKSIDFDLSHTKLVINNIMPQKATGVSVQEIVEFFPFDCVGKLKFNTDVIEAGNLGNPLAFKPGHDFTKQLRSIVSYILQEGDFNSSATPVKRKKSLFGGLFKK